MYIFLDVDGVLNIESDWSSSTHNVLRDENIKELSMYLKQFKEPQIILASSWRLGWSSNYNTCTPQIKELIDKLSAVGLKIIDVTKKSPDGDRVKEIEYFLKRNTGDYIIIDDDISEYKNATPEMKRHLKLVDSKKGFKAKDFQKQSWLSRER